MEQGELLQAAAYAEPPIVPKRLALTLIIIILVMEAIATIVIALRLYVRGWIGRRGKVWGWEDTFSILGYVRLFLFLLTMPRATTRVVAANAKTRGSLAGYDLCGLTRSPRVLDCFHH